MTEIKRWPFPRPLSRRCFPLSGSQLLCSCFLQVNGSRFQNLLCLGGQAIVRRIFKFKNSIWAISSAGRAPGSQSGGQGFDPPMVHHMKNIKWIFFAKTGFLPGFLPPFWHFGSVTKKSRNADIFRILVGRELMSSDF